MYNYGGNQMGIWTFINNGNNTFSSQRWLFWSSGWDAKLSPQLVSGDFNNDGLSDLATMYNYGGNQMGIWFFISKNNYFISNKWLTLIDWDANKMPKIASGDFNSDLLSDITTIYDYGNFKIGIWAFILSK
jgi:hypothetical protein